MASSAVFFFCPFSRLLFLLRTAGREMRVLNQHPLSVWRDLLHGLLFMRRFMYVPLFSFFFLAFCFLLFFFALGERSGNQLSSMAVLRCGETTSLHLRYGVPIKEKTTVNPRKMNGINQ
ncbi:hypothetical protein HDV62DRAFT_7412 [Trichoderma sp. SZMC 28011]